MIPVAILTGVVGLRLGRRAVRRFWRDADSRSLTPKQRRQTRLINMVLAPILLPWIAVEGWYQKPAPEPVPYEAMGDLDAAVDAGCGVVLVWDHVPSWRWDADTLAPQWREHRLRPECQVSADVWDAAPEWKRDQVIEAVIG